MLVDQPDFAAMTGDEIMAFLHLTLSDNPSAGSVTLTCDRTTGAYRLIIT